MSRYAFIAACTEPWPVHLLCQVLAVSPAGYYPWRQGLRALSTRPYRPRMTMDDPASVVAENRLLSSMPVLLDQPILTLKAKCLTKLIVRHFASSSIHIVTMVIITKQRR